MYYYLYEIKNLIDGKIYVGVHKTTNMDDGYMGSGCKIQEAIKLEGKHNFVKVVLEYFEDPITMYCREKEIVNPEFVKRDDVYNIITGGFGGFSHINSDREALILRNKQNRKNTDKKLEIKYGSDWRKILAKLAANSKTAESIIKTRKTKKDRGIKSDSSYMNTPEAAIKRKDSLTQIKHQQGTKNSQFGTCWVMNDKESKKIKLEEISEYISKGYIKGRKMPK